MADLRDSADEPVQVGDEVRVTLERIQVPPRRHQTARAGSEEGATSRAGVEAAQAQGGS